MEIPPIFIEFKPESIVRELAAYGEIEAAEKIMLLDGDAIRQIGIMAYRYHSDFTGERGMMLDTAICKAVVEFLEGRPRSLKRKRRVYPKEK